MTTAEYNNLMRNILGGCKFRYISYDHNKALAEYNSNEEYKSDRYICSNPDSYSMPQKLKDKYLVERMGKLREIHFSPDGKAFKFKIGNKYAKSFRLEDFGVKVFILKRSKE